MSDRRVILLEKAPSCLRPCRGQSHGGGDREIQLVARRHHLRAVDVAEVCRRRNGHIAGCQHRGHSAPLVRIGGGRG